MGNLPKQFNANDYQNMKFQPLPAGEYNVMIVDSVLKPTRRGGEMLALELVVLDGQYQGRKLKDWLNIVNASEDAQRIALGTLSSICRAVGKLNPTDSSELHGRPLVAVVGIRQDDRYGESNNIKRYKESSKRGPLPQVNPTDAPPAPPDWEAEAAKLGPEDDEVPF